MNVNPSLTPLLANQRILDVLRRIQLEHPPFRPGVSLGRRPVIRICGMAVNGANADIARFRRDLDQARAVWGQCSIAIAEGPFTTINADLDYPGWTDYTRAPAALLNQRANCAAGDIGPITSAASPTTTRTRAGPDSAPAIPASWP